MVLVPHQDDEILLAAGILRQAAIQGNPVCVAMVTNGDYGCPDYSKGRKRLRESIEGLKVLGLSGLHLDFLGYADTGMANEDSFLWNLFTEKEAGAIHPSSCSDTTYGLENRDEFHKRVLGGHAPYTRTSVVTDLRLLLEKYRPDVIFTTSKWDTHGDHSGLYYFLMEVLEEMKGSDSYCPQVYSGIVHSFDGDENWPLRSCVPDSFTCPECLKEGGGFGWEDRISFPVPEDMLSSVKENNRKWRALSRHETALEPNAVDFLCSFLKAEEIFWRVR